MKKIILILSILLITVALHAHNVSREDALCVAKDFFGVNNEKELACKARSCIHTENPPYYIINKPGGGYVVVSGDRRVRKILAYSHTGALDYDDMPPALLYLFRALEDKIRNLDTDVEEHASWSVRETANAEFKVLPTALWSQREPYNNHCPEIDGEKTAVGCVGTAMSIIMKFHNYPDKGSGSNSYELNTDNGPVRIDCDFSQLSFDWDNMRESYEEGTYSDAEAEAVAELCNAVSRSIDMDFSPRESSSHPWISEFALPMFLGYSPEITYLSRIDYTKEDWYDILKAEIDAGRPVLYRITAHAIVVDGYDSNGLIHYNWGWGVGSQGFAAIDEFWSNEDLEQAIRNQSAVINIKPKDDAHDYDYRDDIAFFDTYAARHEKSRMLSIDTDKVEAGKLYSVRYFVKTHKSFDAHIGLALVNAGGDIKEVCDLGHHSAGGYGGEVVNINSNAVTAKFEGPVDDDDYLALVASDDGRNGWRFVRHTISKGVTMPVTGNTSGKVRVIFDEIAPELHVYQLEEGTNCCYVPSGDYSTSIPAFNIVPLTEIKGQAVVRINHNTPNYFSYYYPSVFEEVYRAVKVQDEHGGGYFDVIAEYNDVHLSLLFYPDDSLIEVELNDLEPGTLYKRITDNERVKTLKISGDMNENDFRYIAGHLPLLSKLDMSGIRSINSPYTSVPNNIPVSAFCRNVAEVVLPDCVESISNAAFYACPVRSVELPAPVHGIESGAFVNCRKLRQMIVNNPELSEISTRPFSSAHIDKEAILYVPYGTRDKYRQSTAWAVFADIKEGRPLDDNFTVIDIDGIRYEIFEGARAIGTDESYPQADYRVADDISFNGSTYKVSGISDGAFAQLDCNSFDTGNSVRSIGSASICGSFNHLVIGCEVEDIKPWSISPNTPQYLSVYMCNSNFMDVSGSLSAQSRYFTPFITPNFMLSDCSELYVPGKTVPEYRTLFDNIKEMWTYNIDTNSRTIEIVPLLDCIEIERVSLNGIGLTPQNMRYVYDTDVDDMNVEIRFKVNGLRSMTTLYDNEFNSRIAGASFGCVEKDRQSVFPADVYGIDGKFMFRATGKTDLESLPGGMYLIDGKVITVK